MCKRESFKYIRNYNYWDYIEYIENRDLLYEAQFRKGITTVVAVKHVVKNSLGALGSKVAVALLISIKHLAFLMLLY